MNKKTRIAFCFSGQARTLDQTYLFFQKNLFEAAKEQGFDYDVFCAIEDDEDGDKVQLLNPTKVEKIKSRNVEKDIEEIHGKNWRKEIFEDYIWREASIKEKDTAYRFMQQIYKVSKSITLAKNAKQKYDIVVRLRFDCVFFNKINFIEILKEVGQGNVISNEASCFIPYQAISKRLLIINDMFFFGNEKNMFILGDMFKNLKIGLIGGEPKKFLPIIFKIIRKFIIACNNLLHRRFFPIVPILYLESFFYRIYSCEKCFYYFFINQEISVKLYRFSWLIIRNQCSKTLYSFCDKNTFEL